MTTIAAKFSTGEIAADSMVSGDDSFYLVEKYGRARIVFTVLVVIGTRF